MRFHSIAILAVITGTVIITVFLYLGSFSLGEPSNTVIGEKMSPDKRVIATLFERDAALASTAYIVTLRPKGKTFNPDDGIIFIADNTPNIHLVWLSANELRVSVTGGRIFRTETFWKTVNIGYIKKNTSTP